MAPRRTRKASTSDRPAAKRARRRTRPPVSTDESPPDGSETAAQGVGATTADTDATVAAAAPNGSVAEDPVGEVARLERVLEDVVRYVERLEKTNDALIQAIEHPESERVPSLRTAAQALTTGQRMALADRINELAEAKQRVKAKKRKRKRKRVRKRRGHRGSAEGDGGDDTIIGDVGSTQASQPPPPSFPSLPSLVSSADEDSDGSEGGYQILQVDTGAGVFAPVSATLDDDEEYYFTPTGSFAAFPAVEATASSTPDSPDVPPPFVPTAAHFRVISTRDERHQNRRDHDTARLYVVNADGARRNLINHNWLAHDEDGGDYVVVIHGFFNREYNAVTRGVSLHEILERAYPVAERPKLVVVSWASFGTVVNYPYDKESASFASPEVAAVLSALLAKAGRVTVVAHSMGCHLLFPALIALGKKQANGADPADRPKQLHTVAFVAADLRASVVEKALVRRPLELDDLSNAVVGGRIRNYFNPNDRALYYISQVVNWSDRLGLTPLVAAAEAREGFENVDASSDFEISNSHGYLVDVFLDICRWSFGGDQ